MTTSYTTHLYSLLSSNPTSNELNVAARIIQNNLAANLDPDYTPGEDKPTLLDLIQKHVGHSGTEKNEASANTCRQLIKEWQELGKIKAKANS